MNTKNDGVDHYLAEGCGRCSLGGTPNCKVHTWNKELVLLRDIVLDCGLTEELKWGVPCYTTSEGTYGKSMQNRNVLIVAAFKEYCALSFFKGALLMDHNGMLSKPGDNTQSGRVIKFTSIDQIKDKESIIKQYIFEAIEVERAGLKIATKKPEDFEIPQEFQTKLKEMPMLKTAFEALTPGRRRAYLLHFSSPKQSKTREARVEKYLISILNGKGLNE